MTTLHPHTRRHPAPGARLAALVAAAALLCTAPALLWSAPALACGGCFNMAPPPPPKPGEPIISSPVVQDAERVLFVRDEASKVSHVWVEVRYTGLAKDFGWVLPVPKLPKIGVGSVQLFEHLHSYTRPLYFLTGQGSENCKDPRMGCQPPPPGYGSADSAMDAASYADSSAGGGGPAPKPQVEVLASGSTGPYDYVVVKGSEASVLYKWLNDHGYVTPPKAQPILEAHIAKGDVFVAIKLSNGQGVQSIRPITLQMDDAEPCVPLRLTAIAAAEEMSVQVLIAGPGRAVVKNHLDVVINPFRLKLVDQNGPGTQVYPVGTGDLKQEPSNYAQVMAAAIDEAGGRAFVTEAAFVPNKANLLAPWVVSYSAAPLAALADADNWYDVAMAGFGWPTTAELADAVALPGAMTQTFPGSAPLQTIAELQACAKYWKQIGSGAADNFSAPVNPDCVLPSGKVYVKAALQALPVSGAALAEAVKKDLVEPVATAYQLIAGSARLTRLAMRISPDEMDRDPVFAFNPDLPDVAPQRKIGYTVVCPNGWSDAYDARLSIDGLGSWVFKGSNPLDPRFLKAPAALSMAVLEEQGPAVLVAPSQAELVSAAIAGALPGKASLPEGLVLQPGAAWVPPPSDPLVTKLGPWPQPPGCIPKPGWVNGKVPGSAVADPKPDAGSLDGAGADLDSGGAGTVPGIDAAGGWADLDAVSDAAAAPAVMTVEPGADGCSAGSAGQPGAWVGLALAVWLALRLGRRPGGLAEPT